LAPLPGNGIEVIFPWENDTDPALDGRQEQDIILTAIFYLATPQSKTPLGRIPLIEDEGVKGKNQVSVYELSS